MLVVVAAVVAKGRVAADAAKRFTTRLEAAVEADGDDFGADGEEAHEGFDEDSDTVFHGGIESGRERKR